MLEGLVNWASRIVESLGYPGVALLIALEEVFPPIPSEVILPLTGFLVGRGQFELVPAVLAATCGSLGGALVVYSLGYWTGEDRTRRLVRRYGRFMLVAESDFTRASGWFNRHGGSAILVARLVPGARSVISIPAGVQRMPLAKFALYTVAGSGAWNTALISAGWLLGSQWQRVADYLEIVEWALLAALVAGIVWFVGSRMRSRA